MTYELASGEGDSLMFFFIEEESGVIMLKKPIIEGSATTYKVGHLMRIICGVYSLWKFEAHHKDKN